MENSDAAEVAPDLLLRDFGGVSPDRRVRIEMRLADLVEIKKRLADHGELLRQAVRWSPATLTSMSTARPTWGGWHNVRARREQLAELDERRPHALDVDCELLRRGRGLVPRISVLRPSAKRLPKS